MADDASDYVAFDSRSADRIADVVRAAEGLPSNGTGAAARTPGRLGETCWAKLDTKVSGTPSPGWSWQEVFRKPGSGSDVSTWEVVSGGRVGDNTKPDDQKNLAVEMTAGSGVAGSTVLLRRANTKQTDGSWRPAWVIVTGSSLPAPTAKYQVYTPIDDTLVPVWTGIRFMG
ncbi:MAG: hypothetical protein JWO31_1284 [Phycisphaerales bacterium]|nr:hypothetical protein [Phycisphaerales bacterium]